MAGGVAGSSVDFKKKQYRIKTAHPGVRHSQSYKDLELDINKMEEALHMAEYEKWPPAADKKFQTIDHEHIV